MLAHVLVAGGASALVLDLVLAAGVVDLEQNAQPPLCVACNSSNSKFGLETARPICCLANLSDCCAIDCVSRWAVSVPCTFGTELVIVGIVVCTLRTDGVVQTGVANDLAMAGCWWMACSVGSTSCRIFSAPLGLVMSLIVLAQSAIAFMTLSAWVMIGRVMFLCLKLTVSETRSLLVALM